MSATVFSMIISGQLPGTFVWRDDDCAAFMSINPINRGHTLVVPIAEIDHWLDLPDGLAEHLMTVSRMIGRAQMAAFAPQRIGLIIAGFEVSHAHLHVIPMESMAHVSFTNAAPSVSGPELQAAADAIIAHLPRS